MNRDERSVESLFVGRRQQQAAFRDLLRRLRDQSRRSAVLINGPGGYGKTWLLRQLCRIACDEFGLPCSTVDWDEHSDRIRSVIDAMDVISTSLVAHGFRFDSFRSLLQDYRMLPDKITRLRGIFETSSTATASPDSAFENWVHDQLTAHERELLGPGKTKCLSISFLESLRADLGGLGPTVVAFDTYELVDFHRHGGNTTNFCNDWIRRLIADSPPNILYLIAGREDHSAEFRAALQDVEIESISLDRLSRVDVAEFVKHRLGGRSRVAVQEVFKISQGIPLLVSLGTDMLASCPRALSAIGTGPRVSDEVELLRTGLVRLLRYVLTDPKLLTLIYLAALTQKSFSDQLQKDLVSFTCERLLGVPPEESHQWVRSCAETYPSLFEEPCRLRPEVRTIIIDALRASSSPLPRDALSRLVQTAVDAVYTFGDLASVFRYPRTRQTHSDEFDHYVAGLIMLLCWEDSRRARDLFLREVLVRSLGSFEMLRAFLAMFDISVLAESFSVRARGRLCAMAQDPSRPTLYSFLSTIPQQELKDGPNAYLAELALTQLEILLKDRNTDWRDALIETSRVLDRLDEVESALGSADVQSIYHELSALVAAHAALAGAFQQAADREKEAACLKSAIRLLNRIGGGGVLRQLGDLQIRLARSLIQQDDFVSAKACLGQAQRLSPDDATASELAERIPQMARLRAAKLTSESIDALHRSATVDQEAVRKIEQAMTLDPENLRTLSRAVRIFRRIGCHERAILLARRLLELNPRSVSGLIGRGEVYFELASYREAEIDFRSALSIAETTAQEYANNACTNLGHTCLVMERLEEAIEWYAKRIARGMEKIQALEERRPPQFEKAVAKEKRLLRHAHNGQAYAELRMGHLPAARDLFRFVVDMDSGFHAAWIGLCLTDGPEANEHLKNALGACQANIRSEPEKVSYLFDRAAIWLLSGSFPKADNVTHYQDAVRLSKDAKGLLYQARFQMRAISESLRRIGLDECCVTACVEFIESCLSRQNGTEIAVPESCPVPPEISVAVFDVFLSHNSKDKAIVRQCGEALKGMGLKVWLDEWELTPGRSWQDAVEDVIQSAKSAAILIGPDGLGPWEKPEMRACLQEFIRRKLPVIPVFLPGAPPETKMSPFLETLTYVDLRAGLTDEGLRRLVWGITGEKPAV